VKLVNSSETLSEILRRGLLNLIEFFGGRLMGHISENPVETEVDLQLEYCQCVLIFKYAPGTFASERSRQCGPLLGLQ
jgi:hypothetical protein